jgi:hypothetical protein
MEWFSLLPILALVSVPLGRSVEVFVLLLAAIGKIFLVKKHNNIRQNKAIYFFYSHGWKIIWMIFALSISALAAIN